MKYLFYFAVTAPLLLGWLLWQSAHTPPPPPLFHSFAETIHDRAAFEREADRLFRAKKAALVRAKRAAATQQAERRAAQPRLEHTARADDDRTVKLR